MEDGKEVVEGTDWILLLTIALDAEFLGRLASHVWFSDLSLTLDKPPEGSPSLPVTLMDGSVGGHLFWHPPAPGKEMLKWLLPACAVVFAALGGLAIVFIRYAIRTARSLEAQTIAVVDEKWRAETYLDIVGTIVIALVMKMAGSRGSTARGGSSSAIREMN